MTRLLLQSVSGDTRELRDTPRLQSLTRKREFSQMVPESRDLSIMRLVLGQYCGCSSRALEGRRERKRSEKGGGVDERRKKHPMCAVGSFVGLLANYASQKCQGSEHARMNIIQLVIRERTSLGWPPRAVSLMGPHTAAWTVYPMRDEVRGPSVPILCPIRLIPSKVPRLESGHLCGENLSPNFT